METMGLSQLGVDRLVSRSIFSRDFLWIFLSLKQDQETRGFAQNAWKSSKEILPSWGFSWWFSSHGIQSAKNHQLNKSKEVFENSEIVKTFYLRMPTVADRRFWLGSPDPKRCRAPWNEHFHHWKWGFPSRGNEKVFQPTIFRCEKCKF